MAFNILIVDDSSIIRSMIERTIRIAGVPVGDIYCAENGARGLELLEGNWIDLVLADINMPVMDGFCMVEHMSQNDIFAHIPVIVVSTEGSETKIEKLKKLGIAGFVKKPFTPEAIRGVIKDALGEWEHGSEHSDSDSF